MHCAHVHLLGRAGVGAAQAHPRAIHQVMRGIAERLVDVPCTSGCRAIILRMDMGVSSFATNLWIAECVPA